MSTEEQKTRINHYVPQWYQRGFLSDEQQKLHYLNLRPDKITLPNGTHKFHKAKTQAGPSSCFYEYDLYTTFFGSYINDDIEKYLFGNIDLKGAKAVRAIINGNPEEIHYAFQDFFEYIDAQKLRTPKGLDWIKQHYPSLSQLQLMTEMQGLRHMHCTMWTECVREIVSAKNSGISFIISDHPVTLYNAEIPPSDPKDADLFLTGTQTIFVLDASTCLILTHLDYAENPQTAQLLKKRTNARYRGQSLARTDTWIRSRNLTRKDVIAINYLLKCRAKRYIAASNANWLKPEEEYKGSWKDIARSLLPKKNELWGFGGETFVKYKDGRTSYQDAYGRSSKKYELLKRDRIKTNLKPNELCGCGSGLKYKHCCKDIPSELRPTWEFLSIRERNLMLCRAMEDIVGANTGKSWEQIRLEISDEQVKKIHELISILWPDDTDLSDLLPRSRNNVLRAVYQGVPEARIITLTVISWLTYFDEIIITFPFLNPIAINPDFNPLHKPSQYKDDTLRNIYLMWLLQPFIERGLIHVIPDPGDYNSAFGNTVRTMAKERTEGWEISENDGHLHKKVMLFEMMNNHSRLPINDLKNYFKKLVPDIPSELLGPLAERCKANAIADPLAALQPVGEDGQLRFMKGFNLETSLFLAMLTGSIIFTDIQNHWLQLQAFANDSNIPSDETLNPIVSYMSTVEFPLQLNIRLMLNLIRNGIGGEIRAALKRIVQVARESHSDIHTEQLIDPIKKNLATLDLNSAEDDSQLFFTKIQMAIPPNGFDRAEIRRLLLTFSRPELVQKVPVVFYAEYPEIEFTLPT